VTAVELDDEKLRNGLISALIAYSIWGYLPVYFKFVHTVPALESRGPPAFILYVQTFGDLVTFNSHFHALVAGGVSCPPAPSGCCHRYEHLTTTATTATVRGAREDSSRMVMT
jgi:hypothetical protein